VREVDPEYVLEVAVPGDQYSWRKTTIKALNAR
jgi:hypothetical protein